MSMSFEVYRTGEGGQRELICTTQSAREAREMRDTRPGKMIVIGRDDAVAQKQHHDAVEAQDMADDIEGDYLI